MQARSLFSPLQEFANEKFVLLSGARQVGKTTLTNQWLADRNGLYLSWDIAEDRKKILASSFGEFAQYHYLVLDELHKYARWKSWLKGLFDKLGDRLSVVVTGSARLAVFQRGGDSLLGRYERLRLHPFTVGELTHGKIPEPPRIAEDWLSLGTLVDPGLWKQLFRRSGFPEPFLKDEDLQHRRWTSRRRDLLIREDLRDLTEIRNISLVEHLALLLPSRVGSPLSVNSLRGELSVAHDTVSSWLSALDELYYCFRISPFSKKIARSLRKEQKLYLWDWSLVESESLRFENMVASHLLKAVHTWNDIGYGEYQLQYLRDKEKREVDFVIVESNRVEVLIECKFVETSVSPALIHFGDQLKEVPKIQLVNSPDVDFRRGSVRVVSAERYLSELL